MARQTNDGEPTYGRDIGDKTKETEIRPPQRFSGVPAGQLSPAGDEPPLVRSRLSENGAEVANETLSPTGGVFSSPTEPD